MPGKRPRIRAGTQYLLFSAETENGWRVVRYVSGVEGSDAVERGSWREVYDELNRHIGYQVVANSNVDEELVSRVSSASITARECKLNAGIIDAPRWVRWNVKSRTEGMREDKRVSRKSKFGAPLPPEDAVERAQEKVKEWGRRRLVMEPRIA